MEQHIGIQDLPIELLLSIFRLSFDITSLRQDRHRLSLVCHSWRDIVQESAYLWTEISAHDGIQYLEKSLAQSKDLPIDIYYLSSADFELPTRLSEFVDKGESSQRASGVAEANPPQLPDISAFPKLRRLEIDGIPCKISPRGLELHNFLSLNLMDVVNVSAEQLLDVLRNSPYLEGLELGRSPVACPAHTSTTPIHLPHLTTLHLIFMPIPTSNFFLSTIHAPNCSELSISSIFPKLPDDVVRDFLFTSSTNHFAPILRTLLARGRHKDIDITNERAGQMEFHLQFHDQDCDDPTHAIIRFQFTLNSVRQIEETVNWLGDHFQRDVPKISVRLFTDGFEDVQLMDILDFHMTITHLGLWVPSDLEATIPNPILAHMSQHTASGWPLPNLEVFVYEAPEDSESQDEAMLDMLRRRYLSSPEGPDNEQIRPRPIERQLRRIP
ncbi:hypothetical protein FRC04_010923 [Tulasnella sp. 424]|nr:hypothetical protein FRC04_010923 [Tulasnella sp. 424]